MKVLFRVLALAVAVLVRGDAQSPKLELQLQPADTAHPVPQSFTFQLINKTDHDIHLPNPAMQCSDAFDGAIQLRLKFTPLSPDANLSGGGCARDRMNWPPIIERIKTWKTLHPGEALSITADHTHLHYETEEPGKYEFWATYSPPSVNDLDQLQLRDEGIEFPHNELTTEHLSYSH